MLNNRIPDPIAKVRPAEERKQRLMHRLKPRRGHTLYRWDGKGLYAVTEMEYEDGEAIIQPDGTVRKSRRLKVLPENSYVSALNPKNAIKKLLRMGAITPPDATK